MPRLFGEIGGPMAAWSGTEGPTFIFPTTASNSRLGQNKWQIGPAGVFGYLGGKWIAGVFPQQWWSTGGPGSNTISQMNLQYFFSYFPTAGWSVGTSRNMLVNWNANKSSNMITFPIGLSISKVVKIGALPVKFGVQGQYMPVHRDVFGQKWNLQFSVTPVIPKLIKAICSTSIIGFASATVKNRRSKTPRIETISTVYELGRSIRVEFRWTNCFGEVRVEVW